MSRETTVKIRTSKGLVDIGMLEGVTGESATIRWQTFAGSNGFAAYGSNFNVTLSNSALLGRNGNSISIVNFIRNGDSSFKFDDSSGNLYTYIPDTSKTHGRAFLCIIHNTTQDRYSVYHAISTGTTAGRFTGDTWEFGELLPLTKDYWNVRSDVQISEIDARMDTFTRSFLDLGGYTITFNTNGGSEVPIITGATNLPDPLPTTTREGYAFTGWYTDSSLIFPAIPGATITEDTTLYAGWRPNEFTITFNTNGGEPIGQLTKQNHLPDPLPIPIKTGNDFVGWFKDSTLLVPAVPGSPISQNTTLYAKWSEIQSTDIHVPAVNTPSLLQTGFVTMWQPTLDEVRALSSFLWTTNIFDNLRKLFNDPMEALLFLGIIPFDPTTSERGNIYFGNLDSEVESTPIVQQYYTFDFGDVNLSEYYSSFLDYAPNTYAEIFLPFCGIHRLSINEIMGATINVKYNVDVFTGTCLAMLTITKPGLDSVMYSFEGNLMATIPVTAKNYSDLYRRTIIGIASIAATAALGGVI